MHPGMRLGEALARCPAAGARAARPRRGRRRLGGRAHAAGGRRRGRRERAGGDRLLRGERAAAAARRVAGRGCPRDPRRAAPPGAHRRGLVALLRDGGGRAARARRARSSGRAWPAPRRPSPCCAAEPRRTCRKCSSGWGSRPSASWPLPRGAVADRFGPAGLPAHELAHGRDAPLRPRCRASACEESLELEESASGAQLGARARAARRPPARAPRAPRAHAARRRARATLVEGGTWRERVVFREPLADPARMRPRARPAPRAAARAGRDAAPDRRAPRAPSRRRRARCSTTAPCSAARACARRCARPAPTAGPEAALRVLAVDPDSRVPERRPC